MKKTNELISVSYSITESCTYEGFIKMPIAEFEKLKKETEDVVGDTLSLDYGNDFYSRGSIETEYQVHSFEKSAVK